MEWIPIDPENLPKGEVLAANFKVGSIGFGQKLVGWLGCAEVVFCESDDTLLSDVTHYIDIHNFNL